MNAYEISYSADGERVALGWSGGLLAVHRVDPSDGSPAEELARVIHHKATLIHVGWVDEGRLASVSSDGAWAVSDAASGEVLRSGSLAGEYLSAALSPSGAALFVYAYEGTERLWRVATADGTTTQAPSIEAHVSVTSTVHAWDDDRALLRFFEDDGEGEGVREGLLTVDFGAERVEPRFFANGPNSDLFSEGLVLAIDPRRGIGVRPDYEPVVLDGADGPAVVRLEVFSLETLERQAILEALRWPRSHLQGPLADLATSEPGTAEHAEAQDWLIRKVPSVAFVRDTPHLWLGLGVGAVRRLALAGGERTVPVFHGGGADAGPPSLNDVFARNLVNLHTLGVSPGGEYVGFGNPNDFFAVAPLDLETATESVKLPARRTKVAETEMPGLVAFAGERLVIFDRGEGMHLADGRTGAALERVELPEYYGEATDLAVVEDGLLIAVSGGSALLHEAGELMELPFPPHSIAAGAVGERFALVHHNGAVGLFDPESEGVEVVRAPEDEGDPPDEEWDAFEQRWDLLGAAFLTIAGTPHAATIDENDELQLYAFDGASVRVGPKLEQTAGLMAGGADWLAVSPGSEVRLLAMPGGEVTATHPMGQVRALLRGDESGALYAFDDRSGELLRLDGGEREVVFTYAGASCPRVALSEALDRVALVTAEGAIELHALGSGEKLTTLRIEPKETARVLVER